MLKNFPFYKQPDFMDCGATCLRIIAKHYGRSISLAKLRQLSETTREGASLKTLAGAAEKIGFRTLGVKVNFNKLTKEAPLPCIVHWNQQHFVVVYKASPSPSNGGGLIKMLKKVFPSPSGRSGGAVYVSDPAHGLLTYTQQSFIYRFNDMEWQPRKTKKYYVLI